MRASAKEFSVWSRGKFFAAIGILFVAQANLIYLFGERCHEKREAGGFLDTFSNVRGTNDGRRVDAAFFRERSGGFFEAKRQWIFRAGVDGPAAGGIPIDEPD